MKRFRFVQLLGIIMATEFSTSCNAATVYLSDVTVYLPYCKQYVCVRVTPTCGEAGVCCTCARCCSAGSAEPSELVSDALGHHGPHSVPAVAGNHKTNVN